LYFLLPRPRSQIYFQRLVFPVAQSRVQPISTVSFGVLLVPAPVLWSQFERVSRAPQSSAVLSLCPVQAAGTGVTTIFNSNV
jgi:hypothetical protein